MGDVFSELSSSYQYHMAMAALCFSSGTIRPPDTELRYPGGRNGPQRDGLFGPGTRPRWLPCLKRVVLERQAFPCHLET